MKKKKKAQTGDQAADPWISAVMLHALFILTSAGLALDLIFRQAGGVSLCPTEACQLVGEYVRIGEAGLVFMGLVFFLGLWLIYFFARRYNRAWLWGAMTLILMGALAFDGSLLGFQFAVIQEQCQLCIAVGIALLLLLILYALVRGKAFIFLAGMVVWLGGGAAGAMLEQPANSSPANYRLQDIQVLRWSGPEPEDWPRFYFFFSLHCPHCSEVLIHLALEEEAPKHYIWNFIPLDTDPGDLKKIAALRAMENLDDANPFFEILRMEQYPGVPDIEVPRDLEEQIEKARNFFRARGFRGVPLTIIEQSPGVKITLTGAENALGFLRQQGILSGTEPDD